MTKIDSNRRIIVKKTKTGYSLTVYTNDGRVLRDIHQGIIRFFDKIEGFDKHDL